MTERSFHAGFTPEELDAAMIMHSNIGLGERYMNKDNITQIDIIPTIALSLGYPVPFSSLGVPMRSVFIIDSNDISQIQDYVNALNVTTIQMLRWYDNKPMFSNEVKYINEFKRRMKEIQQNEITHFNNKEELKRIMNDHETMLNELRNHYAERDPYVQRDLIFASCSYVCIFILIVLSYFDIQFSFGIKDLGIITGTSFIGIICYMILFEQPTIDIALLSIIPTTILLFIVIKFSLFILY